MVTTERPIVLIDLAAKWTVDAAAFLILSAGFLGWGVIERSPSANILTFAIMAVVALLFDRITPLLPDATGLGAAHERPPVDATQRTWKRYATGIGAGMLLTLCAVQAVFVVALGVQPGFFAGFAAAYCVSRLRALGTVRELERATGVRLSIRLQRAAWRRQTREVYAIPRLV